MNDKFPTREQIEKRAFEIYVERGCQKGSEIANWAAAEKELTQLSRAPGRPPKDILSGDRSGFGPTSMLLDFYGLREQPFGMTPDPTYLYASATHRDALAALKFGIAENRGFFALIAQPGMGKTTLLYRLLEELHSSARTVLVSQTQCTSREFLEYILQELNIDTAGMGLVSMHGKLNEMLFAELLAGRRFVLVVDEAQNLDDSVLETVRMLSNFETHNAKLVQIILAGQPRLATKLAQPQLIQLRQRISVLSHLEPFTPPETAKYIAHRLMIAGHSGEPVFDSAALNEIAAQSDGIPRNINNICFNSLLLSFQRGQRTVTAEVVRGVLNALDLEALIPDRIKSSESVPAAPSSTVSVPGVTPVSAPKKTVTPEPVREISKPPVDVPVVAATPEPVPAPVAIRVPRTVPAPVPAPPSSAKSETIPKPSHAPVTVPPKKAQPSDAYISYEESRRINLKRWQIRSVIVTAILLSAILALAILGRSQSKLGVNSHVFDGTKGAIGSLLPSQSDNGASGYDAAPLETNDGVILTVAAGADQSIRDLSLRYVGHFDNDLSKQILSLNPDLKDTDHLHAGQLIRIPLPSGAIRKMNDTGETPSAEADNSGGLLSKFSEMINGKK
ncbi:MAG TPA: AAA family ATPase [Candidatus Acidoferrales bacterium]|nr:AAA family ATPase [Candidatus Acidoferrales bacterium]